jgi:hypothetical protein
MGGEGGRESSGEEKGGEIEVGEEERERVDKGGEGGC